MVHDLMYQFEMICRGN